MKNQTINIDLAELERNISRLTKLKTETEKSKDFSFNTLSNDTELSGYTAEMLATISGYTLQRKKSIGTLIDNTLSYLNYAKKEYQDKDRNIAGKINGGGK